MTEQQPNNITETSEQEKSLEADIFNLTDNIARLLLATSPEITFPIVDTQKLKKQIESTKPVTIIEREIDLPEASNRASIQVTASGDWLVDNGNSYVIDINPLLEEYALAVSPDFLKLTQEYWKERKARGYEELISETADSEAFDAIYEQKALSFVNTNRISLLEGFKKDLQTAYSNTLNK